MKANDFDNLLGLLGEESTSEDHNYAGYGVIDDLGLTKEQLKNAVSIMWDIIMEMNEEERKSKYLFGKGFLKSKDIFLSKKEKESSLSDSELLSFRKKEDVFRKKCQNTKPLMDFLLKINEVI